ncbi:hypothetical protein [Flammeovirga kamogawensis]|uniref:PorT family protein n=1 Tax=Flammeovirga kamogawensis TaxID=373891 RepID=A0ABX8GYM8_9BACT|nr:hypothetical protein [Flammeovirga kamogawensis]MBB6458857.1 hypothetical protein [Flammeovirga kamogawensis]QWG08438.1 hypothetical protein KM029_05745 [Flammeovirga kamogawensis]TRX66735.1 hypothetical protein EO216_00805 [Flammeovirga kamogawensis]
MTNIKIFLLLFLLLKLYSVPLFAQQIECSEKLISAQNAYLNGNIEAVAPLISNCLKNGFNAKQKEKAYKLLALCNIYLLRKTDAEENIKQILKNNPFVSVDSENDPQEYIELFNSYNREPSFYYGLDAGANLSFGQVDKSYNTTANSKNVTYESLVGFQANVNFGGYFKYWLDWALSIGYKSTNIGISENEIFDGVLSTYYSENQQFVTSKAIFNINFRKKPSKRFLNVDNNEAAYTSPIYPFVRLSFGGNYLFDANAKIDGEFTLEGENEVSTDSKSTLEQRYQYELRLGGGIGLKKQYKRGAFYCYVEYQHALNDLIDASTRYQGDVFLNYYTFISDDYRNQNILFSVGYQHYFYRFKKKRK